MDNSKLAFPQETGRYREDGIIWNEGMTLREYFAGKVMQSLISSYDNEIKNGESYFANQKAHYIAQKAVIMADALINQLKK